MMVIRLAADCFVELPAGASCRSEDDDFVCCDETGRVVARTERTKVMAYGNAQTLRHRANDTIAATSHEELRSRYEKARKRFLELETELHQLFDEVAAVRTNRNLARLESLSQEIAKVHDRDYAPYRAQLLKTFLYERAAA